MTAAPVERPEMSTAEAARVLGLRWTVSVVDAVRRGRIAGRLEDGRWRLDAGSVEAYRRDRDAARERARRPRPPCGPVLPAAPLLRHLGASGGRRARGARLGAAEERALERARRDGWVTRAAGDKLAARVLGLTAREVWGAAWDS